MMCKFEKAFRGGYYKCPRDAESGGHCFWHKTEDGKDLKDLCLFTWGDVPGDDSGRLLKHIKEDLKIDLAENAKIKKSDDSKTITATNEEISIRFKLNEEKNEVKLETSGGEPYEYILKKDNSKLNIYKDLKGEILIGAYLKNVDFWDNANLEKVKFIGANLKNATLYMANLQNADFGWANLQNADLGWTSCKYVSFTDTDMRNVNLYGAKIEDSLNLQYAILDEDYIVINEREGDGYLFSWDEVPGNDSRRLLKYLENNLNIDWAKNAEIEKSDDGKAITVTNGKNSLIFNCCVSSRMSLCVSSRMSLY